MPRPLKCQVCEQLEDNKSLMRKEKCGYIHIGTCLNEFKLNQAFREKEAKEKNILTDTIVMVHKLQSRQSVPHTFYPFLEELRNDSVMFGKIERRYKEGFSYLTLADTYNYCSDNIEWAKNNKQFKNIMAELKYCLVIVKNNIENMLRDKNKKSINEQTVIRTIENVEAMTSVNERIKTVQNINNQQEKDEIDLTSLFD